jgi:hypothetical protein
MIFTAENAESAEVEIRNPKHEILNTFQMTHRQSVTSLRFGLRYLNFEFTI